MSHIAKTTPRLTARVRRIVGQLNAVERALEAGADCSTVLQQVAGARGAIGGLMDELIESHIREHVAHPGLGEAARAEAADELIAILGRYRK